MNEINLVELLKNCPKGMELDCTLFDDVTFEKATNEGIFIRLNNGELFMLSKIGSCIEFEISKCVIFPKGKTTWEGFVPPCKFKDGDIIFTHANCLQVGLGNAWISIFKENRNGGVATYVDYNEDDDEYYDYINGSKGLLCMNEDILRQRFASEEEKQKLFDAIKAKGYKWNAETKTLEKLIPNKFDISTLKPFDKVLVRDTKLQKWCSAMYGFHDNDAPYYPYRLVGGVSRYCIPYKGNEHLLGTTDDCDEYYKI